MITILIFLSIGFLFFLFQLSGFLETLRQQKPNLLYIYSENDKLVEKQIFYEMAQILDAKESQYSKYDAEGNCIVRGQFTFVYHLHVTIIFFSIGTYN